MYEQIRAQLQTELDSIEAAGLTKVERSIETPQSAWIEAEGERVLNFCANNYLGLANHPTVEKAARDAIETWGFGMASVRFICGTQSQHLELEQAVAAFLHTEDAILFSSCFDANGGIFETLFGPEDAIISDELNHASLIDGIRLCKAARYRYKNRDMADLEAKLVEAAGARQRIIVTDGVFSMDGYFAPLEEICALAEKHRALVLVDDSHASGFVGPGGRGTPARAGVEGRVDIITSTFGKALGGASGGFVAGPREVVALLRQRARPYLFSNTIAPVVVAGNLAALAVAAGADEERARLERNAEHFRRRMEEAGFDLLPGSHPIVPVMFGDARVATAIADEMLTQGVYVTAFSYPVVPKGQARIRVQLSAAHSADDIEVCVNAFTEARELVG